jgi:aminopeptidase N
MLNFVSALVRLRVGRLVFQGCTFFISCTIASLANVSVSATACAATANVKVDNYRAHIEPDIAAKQLKGRVTVRFSLSIKSAEPSATNPSTKNTNELVLDAQNLQIETVALLRQSLRDGASRRIEPVSFKVRDKSLLIELPADLAVNTPHEVEIVYRASHGDGADFMPEHQQVFTAFSTSQWMPCVDAPSARATFELTLVVPALLKALGSGRQIEERQRADGKKEITWRLDEAMPSYLYGFGMGPFREVFDRVEGKTTLRYLAPMLFGESQIKKIFVETRAMLAFYKEKSGIDYPFQTYTQLLVKGGAAQEMTTYAAMGERYGERVLTDERRIWLGAHELAHQWWGNAVTNRDWREMWLNEGVATFMNVAFLERRFGREEYLKQIEISRQKYEKIRDAGKDKSLIFPSWDAPTAEDRSLVYDKASYVVHLLREKLGEEKFWTGIRSYTKTHWGQSVVTADFKRAMEAASGENLNAFFEEWIYRAAEPAKKKQ